MSDLHSKLPPSKPAAGHLLRAAVLVAITAISAQAIPVKAQSSETSATPNVTLPAVNVSVQKPSPTTYGGGQVARQTDYGVLGTQTALDMPFSMTTYTSTLIADQQAHTLADVLDSDPSVRTANGYGNFSQVFVIRGFELDGDDVSLNGLYGITPRQMVSTYALDHVDVFSGANAFLNGASPAGSAIGGDINAQLKRAGDTPLTEVTVQGSGSGQLGSHIDIGRRFGSDNQFGIRVNQADNDGETSVDGEHRRDTTTAVSLDWRGDKFRLHGDMLYQRQRIDDGRPIVEDYGTSVPAVPSASYNYGQSWSYSDLEDTVGILRAEYDFAPGWTAYASGGLRHTDEQGEYASPEVFDTGTTAFRMRTPFKQDAASVDAGVRGQFSTGPVTHFVTAGVSLVRIDSEGAYNYSDSYATDLYDTTQLAYPASVGAAGNLADPQTTAVSLMRSVSVSDTLGFLDNRVLLTVGARHQGLVSDNYGYTGQQTEAYNDSITTPVVGLVVKPWQNVSLYANRSQALAVGSQASAGTLNAGALLPPERSTQYEAGVKYDNQKYGATLAVFQIEKPSTYVDSDNYFVADGNERHRGVELSVFGEPYKGLRLIAGATYIDAQQLDTDDGTDGKRPIGVPSFLTTVGADYDVPMLTGLSLNARWIHTGPQYLNTANTLSIPAWDRFDVGARYRTVAFGKVTTFRASVLNLANKAYWSSAIDGYLTEGDPRTILLSMTVDF